MNYRPPNNKLFIFLFYCLLFIFIFSFNFALISDPDFGWHLRYGEEVVVNKNWLLTDIFSHTFKGQGFIETEWLIEAIYYLLFTKYSFLGVAVFSALFTALAFFIPVLFIGKNLLVKFFLTLWAVFGSMTVLGIGARPQNASLVFFSFTLLILLKYVETKSKRFIIFLPLLIFIWANSHPGYILGLFVIFIFLLFEILYCVFDLLKNKKIFHFGEQFKFLGVLFLVLALSITTSNVRPKNPTNIGLLSLDNIKALTLPVNIAKDVSVAGKTRVTISEFLPPILDDVSGTFFFLGIIYAIVLFVGRSFAKRDLRNLILLLGISYFSTLTRRNVPFFFLVFLPLTVSYTEEMINKIKVRISYQILCWLVLLFMMVVSVMKISSETRKILASTTSFDTYCEKLRYPCKAIEFIRQEKLPGKMFNHYNWGAFLTWKLPEYPVFIHGRFSTDNIFSEFQAVTALKEGWEDILDKYNVSWIIMPRNQRFEVIAQTIGKWRQIYADEIAVILIKK